jgi:mono/diheme cytochrome c family protein
MTMRIRLVFALAALGTFPPGIARADGPDPRTVRTWKAKCSACHGEDGKGQTEQGKKMGIGDMSASAWQKDFTDAKITDAVAKGVKREKNGKHQEMDPFAGALKPDQVTALIGYIRTFTK